MFYGPSIDFSEVKVRSTSVAAGGRPWTANNTIRFPKRRCLDAKTLIHELAHVWQYQNGNMQLLHGLAEQIGSLLGKDPYDYSGAAGVQAAVITNAGLTSFSNESQAQIVEDYWWSQNGGSTGYGGGSFTAVYIQNLAMLVSGAGIGTTPPTGSNGLEAAIGGIVNAVLGLLRQ